MKTIILVAFAVLSLGIGAACAQCAPLAASLFGHAQVAAMEQPASLAPAWSPSEAPAAVTT